jgi:hypothetical protein
MAKLADAADLKSADLNRSWGFKSPSGHQQESHNISGLLAVSLGQGTLRDRRSGHPASFEYDHKVYLAEDI